MHTAGIARISAVSSRRRDLTPEENARLRTLLEEALREEGGNQSALARKLELRTPSTISSIKSGRQGASIVLASALCHLRGVALSSVLSPERIRELGIPDAGGAELVAPRYPNLEAAARFAIQAADATRRAYVEQAVTFFRAAALQAESDPSPDRWLLDIREKADELRHDALEPTRVRARDDADEVRTEAERKIGRAGWGRGAKKS